MFNSICLMDVLFNLRPIHGSMTGLLVPMASSFLFKPILQRQGLLFVLMRLHEEFRRFRPCEPGRSSALAGAKDPATCREPQCRSQRSACLLGFLGLGY